MDIDYRIFDAIIKGIKEHDDSTAHFGSLGGHDFYLSAAKQEGFIDGNNALTEKGEARYREGALSTLSDCRWMFWSNDDGKVDDLSC